MNRIELIGKHSHRQSYEYDDDDYDDEKRHRRRKRIRIHKRRVNWKDVCGWIFIIAMLVTAFSIAWYNFHRIGTTQSSITDIQNQIDDLEVSIITTPPPSKNVAGTVRNMNIHNKTRHGRSAGPPTLPLPPGYTVFHTANCFYQDGDPLALNHLEDVDLVTVVPVPGNVLGFDAGGKWMPTSGPGMSSINDLGDVMVPTPSVGDVLVYTGPDWINALIGATNVDDSDIQLRVTGVCGIAGEHVKSIDAAGTVVCDGVVAAHTHDASDIISGTLDDARISSSSVVQYESSIDHDSLLNYVVGQHRSINDAGTGVTELWSASKIDTELAGKVDDFNTLVTDATPTTAVDVMAYYDMGAGAHRKLTMDQLFALIPGGGSGDVVGPLSATDTAVCLFNGITGKIIQNSVVTITGAGAIDGVSTIGMSGTITVGGNIVVVGTVDGRDVATDGTTQDNHIADGDIHVDHTAVSVTGGIGLTGGGTIDGNQVIDMDINSLVTHVGSPDVMTDFLLLYDSSVAEHKKVLIEDLGISGILWRNAWVITTVYSANDAVENGGSSYICILSHTASATDEPGVGVSYMTFWDLVAAKGDTGAAGGGETNTGSNVNAGGVGVFEQKNLVDLEFRGINTLSSRLTVALDAPNNEIDLDVDETAVDHNNLLNYVVGQHRVINDAGTSATELWSASKISTDLSGKADTVHTHTASQVTDFSTAADARIAAASIDALADVDTTTSSPATGQRLEWDGSNWVPVDATIHVEITATVDYAGTGVAYGIITGMTSTPAAGTYWVSFSASARSSSAGTLTQYAIFSAGVVVPHSERDALDSGGGQVSNTNFAIHTQCVVTLNGAQAVTAQSLTASGTLTIHERSMMLIRLS